MDVLDDLSCPTLREKKLLQMYPLKKKKKTLPAKLHTVESWVNSIHSAETSGKGGKYFFAGLGVHGFSLDKSRLENG